MNYIDDIICKMDKMGCIQKGYFKPDITTNNPTKYLFNTKCVFFNSELLQFVGDKMYSLMGEFDVICAVSYESKPLADYISDTYNKKMIFIDENNNIHGTEKMKNKRCVLVDDILASGKTMTTAFDILKSYDLNITTACVLIDRQELLVDTPFSVVSLFTKTDYIRYELARISREKNSNFIFSGDLYSPIQLLNLLSQIGDYIVICKTHLDCIQLSPNIMPYDEFKIRLLQLSIEKDFLIMEDRKFVDISSIVDKQYKISLSWVDLVTVHGSVNPEVLTKLSGIVLVSNMSNNCWNFDEETIAMSKTHSNRVIGFVTQYKLSVNGEKERKMVQMTPGISGTMTSASDQKYRAPDKLETDYMIVGRAVYNSEHPVSVIKKYLGI